MATHGEIRRPPPGTPNDRLRGDSHGRRHTGSVRFDVRVRWKTKTLAKIKLEVSGAEGGAGRDYDSLPSFSLAEQFGMAAGVADVPCLPLRYQVAQKLHAVSDPREDNDRFRDLIDLIILDDLNEDGDEALREACTEIFALRDQHAWPPQVVAHEDWDQGYQAMAAVMNFPITDLSDALRLVRAMVARIEAAGR